MGSDSASPGPDFADCQPPRATCTMSASLCWLVSTKLCKTIELFFCKRNNNYYSQLIWKKFKKYEMFRCDLVFWGHLFSELPSTLYCTSRPWLPQFGRGLLWPESTDHGRAGRKTGQGQTKEEAHCHALEWELLQKTDNGHLAYPAK